MVQSIIGSIAVADELTPYKGAPIFFRMVARYGTDISSWILMID